MFVRLAFSAFFALLIGSATAAELTLATTTSAKDSGLLEVLLDRFKAQSGIEVRVIAVGTGQAFEIARRGDADIVLAHDEEQELRFMQEGFGLTRLTVMHNDFVLVGPKSNPAKATGSDVVGALRSISEGAADFVTRGDKSGTHAAELRLWKLAGLHPTAESKWYKNVGAGMGAALNVASGVSAYILSDRATWLKFSNKGDLKILVEGSPLLRNQYSVLTVSTKRFPHVKGDQATALARWLASPDGQATITGFRVQGQQVFFIDGS